MIFNTQLNRNVQHNSLFIVFKATCFDLQGGHHQAYITTCHRLLCTYWDPNLCYNWLSFINLRIVNMY
jgi:hypothetical protein